MKININKRSGAVLRTKNKYCNEDISIVLDSKLFPAGKINISDTKEVDVTKYEKAQIVDENLKAENIAEGVEVLGITGTHAGGGIEPAGTKEIDQNGLYDIKEYEFVDVSVKEKPQQQKSVEYIENGEYEVLPDEDNVLSQVMVSVNVPIPSGKIDITTTNEIDVTKYASAQVVDENLKAENIAEGIEILGVVGEFKGGVDTSDGTITPDKVLKDEIGYAKDERIIGTIETYDYSNSEEVKPEIDKFILNEFTDYYNNRVTEIGGGVFYGSTVLKSVNFPNVIQVGVSAFANTSSLTDVDLPNCETILNAGFQQSKALIEISLPKIKKLYVAAFGSCPKLKKVYLGNDLTEIQAQTFAGDTTLETLIIDSETVPTLQNLNAFYNCSKVTIYVRDTLLQEFKSKTNWSSVADKIKPKSELPMEVE